MGEGNEMRVLCSDGLKWYLWRGVDLRFRDERKEWLNR